MLTKQLSKSDDGIIAEEKASGNRFDDYLTETFLIYYLNLLLIYCIIYIGNLLVLKIVKEQRIFLMDVNHINPFLQSSISVIQAVTQLDLTVGKPELTNFKLKDNMYVIKVGIFGEMEGQAILAFEEVNAKDVASRMMMGMQVNQIDELAASALNELSNMIMGNTATIFSTKGILVDITTPVACMGNEIKIKSEYQGIRIPLLKDGEEYIELYIGTN